MKHTLIIKYENHLMLPGHTITGAIKLYNKYDLNKTQMDELLDMYNILNEYKTPKVGQTVKIPVMEDL